jgi:putative cardiolipin synthase
MRGAVTALCVAIALMGCASPRRDVAREPSTAWPHPEETALGRDFGRQLAAHPGQSGFYLLDSGMDAFVLRAALAENAQRTLDLQYYMVHADTTTQLLLYRVLHAADRGVRVRLLLDDLYALGQDIDLATFAAHPNIEVRLFNPFLRRGGWGLSQLLEFIGDSARLNRRMHNKLWIADNAAAIVGGRNLGDEYFDASGADSFTDVDILAAGPVVRDISRSFDDYWNSEWAVPVEAFVATTPAPERLAEFQSALEARLNGFRDSDYAAALRETARLGLQLRSGQLPLTPANAVAVYDKPAKISRENSAASPSSLFTSRVRPLIEAAEREVILISPYFIPSEDGIEILSALARRGVRVRILTNSLASTDYVPLAYTGYARRRAGLLAAGLELYEMRPETADAGRDRRPGASSGTYLHTKAIVVDRKVVLVGSMNLDPRSRLSNTESAVLIESGAFGDQLGALFDKAVHPTRTYRVALAGPEPGATTLVWITEDDGKEVRYDQEPAGFWRRLSSKLLGAFAPDDVL